MNDWNKVLFGAAVPVTSCHTIIKPAIDTSIPTSEPAATRAPPFEFDTPPFALSDVAVELAPLAVPVVLAPLAVPVALIPLVVAVALAPVALAELDCSAKNSATHPGSVSLLFALPQVP